MNKEHILTILALEELKALGYEEVWIGRTPNPHWPDHGGGDCIIAAPKKRIAGWPSLWTVSEKTFGEQGCGNGLKNADQCQRQKVREMIPGHYKLNFDGINIANKEPSQ
jgi:hypothetical protein